MIARLELKGFDGNSHTRWGMWFNAITHAKSYQFLAIFERSSNRNVHNIRGCMAVVSLCSEIEQA